MEKKETDGPELASGSLKQIDEVAALVEDDPAQAPGSPEQPEENAAVVEDDPGQASGSLTEPNKDTAVVEGAPGQVSGSSEQSEENAAVVEDNPGQASWSPEQPEGDAAVVEDDPGQASEPPTEPSNNTAVVEKDPGQASRTAAQPEGNAAVVEEQSNELSDEETLQKRFGVQRFKFASPLPAEPRKVLTERRPTDPPLGDSKWKVLPFNPYFTEDGGDVLDLSRLRDWRMRNAGRSRRSSRGAMKGLLGRMSKEERGRFMEHASQLAADLHSAGSQSQEARAMEDFRKSLDELNEDFRTRGGYQRPGSASITALTTLRDDLSDPQALDREPRRIWQEAPLEVKTTGLGIGGIDWDAEFEAPLEEAYVAHTTRDPEENPDELDPDESENEHHQLLWAWIALGERFPVARYNTLRSRIEALEGIDGLDTIVLDHEEEGKHLRLSPMDYMRQLLEHVRIREATLLDTRRQLAALEQVRKSLLRQVSSEREARASLQNPRRAERTEGDGARKSDDDPSPLPEALPELPKTGDGDRERAAKIEIAKLKADLHAEQIKDKTEGQKIDSLQSEIKELKAGLHKKRNKSYGLRGDLESSKETVNRLAEALARSAGESEDASNRVDGRSKERIAKLEAQMSQLSQSLGRIQSEMGSFNKNTELLRQANDANDRAQRMLGEVKQERQHPLADKIRQEVRQVGRLQDRIAQGVRSSTGLMTHDAMLDEIASIRESIAKRHPGPQPQIAPVDGHWCSVA